MRGSTTSSAALCLQACRSRRKSGLFLLTASFLLFPSIPALALPVPTQCQVDPRGANDRPGQRDVTKFCVEQGEGAPYDLHTSMSFDETTLTGANTMDTCLLFDTDADAFANVAVCVTLGSSGSSNGNLTEMGAVRLLRCNDTRANKCMNPVAVTGALVTSCEASHPEDDPFGPVAEDGPGDDYPFDSQVVCAIDFADFEEAASARLVDACSYPSQQPNSDEDDCILYSTCSSAEQCDDGNPCSADTCDPSGVCRHAADETAACSDGLYCTGAELCSALGFCVSGGAPLSCDDGIACTIDACDEYTDRCINDPRSSLCDDALYCNGVESCDAASGCATGTPPDCSDGIDCTADSCEEATQSCGHAPLDSVCDDGQYCNGAETCDALAGCVRGAAPACDDGIACTTDACDEAADACRRVPDDSTCSDGLFCNGAESCDAAAGCVAGPAPDCDDHVGCTVDSCEEGTDLCEHVPDNTACTDGAFCNGVEICDPEADCVGGEEPCVPPAVCDAQHERCIGCVSDAECDNGVFCDGREVCNLGTATCQAGPPLSCDDGVACTLDECDEIGATCRNTPNDATCDDGQFCNGVETCSPLAGCQASAGGGCDDGIDCTVDSCTESTDRCTHRADDGLCDDARFCNGQETCHATRGCEEGEEVACEPDRFRCTVESCDEATDSCESDFTRCVCGDFEVTGLEDCDPPAKAGQYEDCNNLIDDDKDGLADCVDPDCEPGSSRGNVCDEACHIDALCARVASDPATIKFNRKEGSDSLWIHGRFPIESIPDPLAEGFQIELSNEIQPIYVASLGPNDLIANESDSRRFAFVDKDARLLGEESARGGLALVNLTLREIDGQTWMAFRVRAYGDFSTATRRRMSSQIGVGNQTGALTQDWSAKRRMWFLRQREF